MAVKISVCRLPSVRPSLRVVCLASVLGADPPVAPTASRRQMLKMRLMAENEGGKEGDFAPLIDASAKSEKCSPACTPGRLPFPHSLFPSFSLSFRSSQSGHSIKHLETPRHLSRSLPPFFGDSFFFLHFEMQMFVLLPASCALLVSFSPQSCRAANTACFRVCWLLASFSTPILCLVKFS